jgi:hypothetical protein
MTAAKVANDAKVIASVIHRDPGVRNTGVEPMVGDQHVEAITTGGPVAGDHQEADVRRVGLALILP